MSPVMLLQLGMPVAMAISGLVAWRVSRRTKRDGELPAWRDDSLDDWRREQAAEYERARGDPASSGRRLEESVRTGAEKEMDERRQSRIGG